jgi:uncharacterized protein YgiM (DUF1202 family)
MEYRPSVTRRRGSGRARIALLCTLAVLASSVAVKAETAYVTDVLQLSLSENENGEGKVLRTLVSGTELELLERKNYYAKVRTRDGVEGWTKAAFLVSEKPARQKLNELESRSAETEKALELAQAELATTQETLTGFQTRANQVAAALREKDQELGRLRADNANYRSRLGESRVSVPVDWALIAAGITLILGFIGGLLWFDYRSRRRHGGFRIY